MTTNQTNDIHVAASIATPSDCTDTPGAVDVNVTVTIGDREYDGEVTLAPQQYDGRLAAYGTSADMWISSGLLADLYAACESATGAAPSGSDAARQWFRGVLDEIESAAVEAAS